MSDNLLHLVHIQPWTDAVPDEYHLFASNELAWEYITDRVRRGWRAVYDEDCPDEITDEQISDYMADTDETIRFFPMEVETEWKPKPRQK